MIRLSKQFFPTLSEGFNHPKVHVHVGDGFEFLEKHQDESFDVIITDSSDPVGKSLDPPSPLDSLDFDSFNSLCFYLFSYYP